MAALPEHVVALIVEIISGDPVSWEDAVTEGGLRIIRFHDFEEQRILVTVDRSVAWCYSRRVLLGIRRILSTSSPGAEAEEAHGKGVADGLRRGCMQWGCGDCYCWLRVLHCHIVPSCSLLFFVGRLCFVWSWLWYVYSIPGLRRSSLFSSLFVYLGMVVFWLVLDDWCGYATRRFRWTGRVQKFLGSFSSSELSSHQISV